VTVTLDGFEKFVREGVIVDALSVVSSERTIGDWGLGIGD
jgi:hypothetical protein